MAEETLKYKLDIDDTDFAQKLSEVSARINASVTNAFSGAGVPGYMSTPGPAQFVSPFEQPVLVPPTPSFTAYNPGGFLDTARGFALNTFGNVQTGFNMAAQDLGLHSNDIIGSYERGRTPDFTGGYFSSMAGAFGIGYDPTMPLSGADYRTQNARQMSNSIKGFGSTVTDIGIGMGASMLGSAALVAGGVVGFPLFAGAAAVGFGANATLDFMMADQKAMEEFSSGVLKMGGANLPGYSQSQAMDFSRRVFDFTKTETAKIEGIDMTTASNVMLGFTAAGGFNNVNNAQEFETKAMGAIENMRSFMRTFNMFQEEAVKLMGDLENRGISGAENGGSFAARIGGLGSMYGINPTSLVSQMVSTSDALRPFGYDAGVSANFALDARLEMQRMNQSYDPYSRKAISTLGGTEAATNGFIQDSVNLGGTRLGTLFTATALGGGDPYGGTIQGVSAAANFYSNPTNYFAQLHDQQGMWEKVMGEDNSSLGMSNFLVGKAMQDLQLVGQGYGKDGKMDQSAVKGYMMQLAKGIGMDMSAAKADMMMQMVINGANTDYNLISASESGAAVWQDIKNQPFETIFGTAQRKLTSAEAMFGYAGAAIGGVLGFFGGAGIGAIPLAMAGAGVGVSMYKSLDRAGVAIGPGISKVYNAVDESLEDISDYMTGTYRIRASEDGYNISTGASQILRNFSTSDILQEAITIGNSKLTESQLIEQLGDTDAKIDNKLFLRMLSDKPFKGVGQKLSMDEMDAISMRYTKKSYADSSDSERETIHEVAGISGYGAGEISAPGVDYVAGMRTVASNKLAEAKTEIKKQLVKHQSLLGLTDGQIDTISNELLVADKENRFASLTKSLTKKVGGVTQGTILESLEKAGEFTEFNTKIAAAEAAQTAVGNMETAVGILTDHGMSDKEAQRLGPTIAQDIMNSTIAGIDWQANIGKGMTGTDIMKRLSNFAQVGVSNNEQQLRARYLSNQLDGAEKVIAGEMFNDTKRNVNKLVGLFESVLGTVGAGATSGAAALKVQVVSYNDKTQTYDPKN